MSEAGLEQRLRQAEAAVVKAQAAYDTAHDGSKTLCGQQLLAEKKQLMEGTGCTFMQQSHHYLSYSVRPRDGFREIFIVIAAAASPSASDCVGAFKAKLKLHSITRLNADAMSRLILYFPQQMMMMAQAEASSDDAMLLYTQTFAQPGTQTALNMLTDLHIAVNGPWLASHPQLVTGVDLQSNSLLILKLLPPCIQQQKQAAQAERHAIEALGLDNVSQQSALVQCSLVKVCISIEHATILEMGEGQYDAMKMPRFVASLSQLPQLLDDIIDRGALRLQSALHKIHAVSLPHADVKSDNVVLNTADMCR